ncbi:uncharacterized protein LOC133292369 isoform X1 [Gastrolobium bilobum]|uniref:uncharacterized protein LOC133292369 isoform X1 n=2 Tax=Gastrolobium bilobum TaxID=150636 RepID=UPI002AAFF4B3|nr:uncharacterized protein LOC133292369 isoform X1 [Gastrolobium bilobum]
MYLQLLLPKRVCILLSAEFLFWKVNIQSTSIALRQTCDLTASIKSMLTSFSPSVDKTAAMLSELAKVVAQERQLLQEFYDLFPTISVFEFQERSAKCKLIQLEGWQRMNYQLMLKSILGCCKVYISESRNRSALESIERAAKLFPLAPIINKFEDVAYNRIGYTLVSELGSVPSSEPCHLTNCVLAMVKAAFDTIDFELHTGTHPRLGVVDHICFHPMADASLDQAARIARCLAMDMGSSLQVPTFLYGAAHEEGRTLDSIRRVFGYFKPNSSENQWIGGLKSDSMSMKPDSGPSQVTPSKGVLVIGATNWVDNYNVPLISSDISAIRRIAKRVSGRGGGLPSVQAMALAHGEGVIEVACNLLDPNKVGGERVQQEVESLAREEGISVGRGYFTDFSQEEIIKSYLKLIEERN